MVLLAFGGKPALDPWQIALSFLFLVAGIVFSADQAGKGERRGVSPPWEVCKASSSSMMVKSHHFLKMKYFQWLGRPLRQRLASGLL